ncbi:MAG: hypothetical protein MZU91_10055 [Desulfosudis oleivorans]|nr:hypothetical protein [Desulfosudis oleivorans]
MGHSCFGKTRRGDQGVRSIFERVQAEGFRLIIKRRPRQNCQGKNIEMVWLQTEGIIEAFLKSLGCVAREPVNKVQPENSACRVQQRYLFSEFNGVDGSVDIGEDFGMSALKSNLEAAVDPGKKFEAISLSINSALISNVK